MKLQRLLERSTIITNNRQGNSAENNNTQLKIKTNTQEKPMIILPLDTQTNVRHLKKWFKSNRNVEPSIVCIEEDYEKKK